MAEISKITLPNGDVYDLKDATARDNSGVTGVKGNSESSYRTGNVNLTAANIGALPLSGGTMTGQLKTSFKNSIAIGSYSVNATTIPNICEELRYSSGCCGSFNLTTAYTKDGYTVPTGWYNFLWIPHRSGGINGTANGDNCNYGALYFTTMNTGKRFFIITYVSSSISNLMEFSFKTHTHSPADLTSGYLNIHPENNPVLIPFMHNDIAHLLKRGGSTVVSYDGVIQNVDISNVFDASGSYWVQNPTGITEIVIEITLHKTFGWTNWIYVDFGSSSWRAAGVKIEVMNSNYAEDIWTQKYSTESNSLGHVAISTSHQPVGATNTGGGFNKIRFTFSKMTAGTATIFRISQIGIYNYASLGLRETYMSRGDDDLVYRDISPNSNNIYSLGTSSHKWKNVYANTLNGTTIPSTPKFTDTTYAASTVSIGSASAGTVIPADDITAWTTNTPTAVTPATVVTSASGATATVTNGVLSITNGSFGTGPAATVTAGTAASLSYTAKSIPNISVTSKTVVTGITAS